MQNPKYCDVVIVGSGIAGLTVGWKLAKSDLNLQIIIVTKKERTESNTNYAQGGIAAVVSPLDSFEDHIQDTLIAGDGLCLENIVEMVVSQGPNRVQELVELGAKFSKTNGGQFDLGKEGGHSKRRVIHAKDLTGREIERALLNHCEEFPNLRIYENTMGIDLYKNQDSEVTGIYVFDANSKEILPINAKKTVIATGGAGKVYNVTSNPNIATGDGIAIAARAGASIGNLEFTQFHPTCVYRPEARPSRFLISEALRGEGAKLLDFEGERFMPKYDSREELAPRDIVARAIDSELKISGAECVFLDISHLDSKFLKERFPGINKNLLEMGIDFTKENIPVVPAAHYFCGGIITNEKGQSDLKNLYAVGEVSCTGLHGANRLASNSLLEAVVFGHNLSLDIISKFRETENTDFTAEIPTTEEKLGHIEAESEDKILISHNWEELRLTMSNYVGIVRSDERLNRALKRVRIIKEEINKYYNLYKANNDLIELRNIVDVAELIILSAMGRKESRGIHYNINYPDKSQFIHSSVIKVYNSNYTYSSEHKYLKYEN